MSREKTARPQRDDKLLYHALTPVGGHHCHVYFHGQFDAIALEWDAHILTLEEAYQRQLGNTGISNGSAVKIRQYIEVGEVKAQRRQLTVALKVEHIDVAVILKTIVMINNYKRLQFGQHEYGPYHCFPSHALSNNKGTS